jgi:alkanesulfonate monooxygenase SsuD/methylene tetrahydromethanopterin reductase-like flavin-dependent oxidoreductase (luciferase family)
MDLSLVYELQTNDNSREGVRRCYTETVEQVKLADELGFRTVWVTEHHFLDRFSFSSAPEIFLGHLAAHTKRIRLGHAIVLLPFLINHPLRVAEHMAVLDVLSDGRAEFGGGRAISEGELSGFNVDPEITRPQWLECLKMLPKMWTQESFSWDSELISIPERQVVPKPFQQPHPPMSVACTQPSSVEIAADHGLGVLGFGIGQYQSNDYVRTYRERIKKATPVGSFVHNRFALFLPALCARTDEEAMALRGSDLLQYLDEAKALFTPWADGKAPASYAWFMEFSRQNSEMVRETKLEDMAAYGGVAIGSPESCLKTLNYLADAGVDEVLLFLQGYTTPHEAIMESLRLLAEEVMPNLHPTNYDL